MARVVLENVGKTYPNGFVAVRDLSLEAADGEFLVLVGPSGSGKTTTLRLIAGLEDATGGTIRIGDRIVNDVHPKDRDIAMVFQNYALYPHMTVYRNMAFALKLRRVPRDEIDRRVRGTAQMLGIHDLLDKRPRVLSGGQRQRVAVGRAIVREPKAFLFDEPLSNLDARLRVSTRAELKALHQRLKTTTVYVTHDQEEAMTLGDRIAVMSDGILRQAAAPLEVYRKPVNRFVASFIGTPPMNFLDGTIERNSEGAFFVEQPPSGAGAPAAGGVGTRLRLAPAHADRLAEILGRPLVLGVRPQSLSLLRPGATDGAPVLTLSVSVVEPLGDSMDVHATTSAGRPVVARVPAQPGVVPGAPARVALDMSQAHFFEPGDLGRNLTL